MAVVFAAITVLSLMSVTLSARKSGNTVLLEDYYHPDDPDTAKVPGLVYRCAWHGSKMVEYYVEEENGIMQIGRAHV